MSWFIRPAFPILRWFAIENVKQAPQGRLKLPTFQLIALGPGQGLTKVCRRFY
jgi:hypothetical protein